MAAIHGALFARKKPAAGLSRSAPAAHDARDFLSTSYLDGFALRVRSAGKVVSVPVLGVVGVLPDGGKQQRLALDVCGGESFAAWKGWSPVVDRRRHYRSARRTKRMELYRSSLSRKEHPTPFRLEVRCSIPLSYGRISTYRASAVDSSPLCCSCAATRRFAAAIVFVWRKSGVSPRTVAAAIYVSLDLILPPTYRATWTGATSS